MSRKKINRAGLIPFIREDNIIKMLFMCPSEENRGGKSFQLAKGKQEQDEEITRTAIREAQEELGLFEHNIVNLFELGEWLGRTTIYIAEIKDKDMFGDPVEETKETKWMSLTEFQQSGRMLHKPIVEAAYRKILKIGLTEEASTLSILYNKVQKRVDNGIPLKTAVQAVAQSHNAKSSDKITAEELNDYYDSKQVSGKVSTSQPGLMGYS